MTRPFKCDSIGFRFFSSSSSAEDPLHHTPSCLSMDSESSFADLMAS